MKERGARLSALAIGLVWVGTVGRAACAAADASVVLRTQPVSLSNVDGRCVRNAMLQATTPLAIEVLNLHAQRTGTMPDDRWLTSLSNLAQFTRAELIAMVLARSALCLNTWNNEIVIEYIAFNATICATTHGVAAAQSELIARDIADGLTKLFAVRVAYCQLPTDRDHLPHFTLDAYIATQVPALRTEPGPDFLVVDADSSKTATLDQYSMLSNLPLSVCAEHPLSAAFDVPGSGDKPASHYELISFCNFERSGLSAQPTWYSRALGFLRWCASCFMFPQHTFPERHATAVARYGDTWYATDDVRIWRVDAPGAAPLNIGQALLSQYPGMRTVVIYKKTGLAADQKPVNPAAGLDLTLTKVSSDRHVPFMAWWAMLLVVALLSLALWCGYLFALYGSWWYVRGLRGVLRAVMCYVVINAALIVTLIMWGSVAHHLCLARAAYRASASSITLAATDGHMSGLYSTPHRDVMAGDRS